MSLLTNLPWLFAVRAVAILLAVAVPELRARAADEPIPEPSRIGQCVQTTVTSVGHRIDDSADSGSAIGFSTGLWLVDYEAVKAIDTSRVGDRALVCYASREKGCKPDDDRGKSFRFTNLRTHLRYTGSDRTHGCTGA